MQHTRMSYVVEVAVHRILTHLYATATELDRDTFRACEVVNRWCEVQGIEPCEHPMSQPATLVLTAVLTETLGHMLRENAEDEQAACAVLLRIDALLDAVKWKEVA